MTVLAKVGLSEAGSLYRLMAETRGWTPRQTDECELWELAVILGLDKEGEASAKPLTGRALLAARVKAHAEGRPPPSISLVPTSGPPETGES